MPQFDVIIAGCGVVGLSVAWRLAAQGARVVVLDPDQKGGRGSRAAAGVAIPSVRISAHQHLNEFARLGLQALESDLQSLSVAYQIKRRGSGVMRLVTKEAEKERLEAALEQYGQASDVFYTRDELVQMEPVLEGSSILGGYVQQAGFVVDVEDYMDALVQKASQEGVSLRLGEAALAVEADNQGVTVRTHTGSLRGAWFVLAAGAWSGTIAGLPSLPISPLRGQMLVVTQPPLSLKHIVSGRGYLVPWRKGGVMVGATEEEAGFHDYNTPNGLLYLLGMLSHLAPSLREAPITSIWAGLRAATRSGAPLIGFCPGMQHVLVASGHTGQGILTGALTGQAVADLINSGRSAITASFEVAINKE